MHGRTDRPEHTRRLFHFPIIHMPADLGTLSESVQRATLQKLGVKGWRHKSRAVEQMWCTIEQILQDLPLPFPQVRLYQDGLPVCGMEKEIVSELARQGSRNHQLLVELMRRGATLMGTESAELLRGEYLAVKQQLPHPNSPRPGPGTGPVDETPDGTGIFSQRNRFIAQRINDTLLPGETGILFLGMLHRIEEFLDEEIEIIHPLGRPSNKVTS